MTQTISLDVRDYLSDGDIRQIVIEEFRAVARKKSADDFQRILDNAAYELVRKEVDAVFDGGMAETVRQKAVEVINKLTDYTVFRRPDAWDRAASKGWEHLQSAIDDAKPLIVGRVNEIVATLDPSHLHELVSDRIGSVIVEKLTGSNP